MNLKAQLSYFLKERGWSAAQLAAKAKVPRATLYSWTAGGAVKNIDALKRVADVLEVSLDEILYGEPGKRRKKPDQEFMEALGEVDDEGWLRGAVEIMVRPLRKGRRG